MSRIEEPTAALMATVCGYFYPAEGFPQFCRNCGLHEKFHKPSAEDSMSREVEGRARQHAIEFFDALYGAEQQPHPEADLILFATAVVKFAESELAALQGERDQLAARVKELEGR